MESNADALELRRAKAEEILPLRHNVLTVGTQRLTSDYPGDNAPQTRHYGAFDGSRNLACCTFLPSEWEGEPAWQLRGMAVEPEHRNRGLGAALLAFAEEDLGKESSVRVLWCNARQRAVAFYLKHGWQTASEEFDIAGVGPHRKMTKRL